MRTRLHPDADPMSNNTLVATMRSIQLSSCRWLIALAITLFATPSLAAPTAVDDNVAVLSNTPVFGNDLASNDVSVPTDTYTITVPPSNGTATLTADGLLDYTPNIGFASVDTFTYSIDDGAGGVDTATVTLDVVLSSDFLTPGNNFLIGLEDIPTPLNLTVDPSLEYGGTLQDVIGVDALYRSENQSGIPVTSTIPTGTTGINVTGYATRNVGTSLNDGYNDDYELLSININLREGTYSGRLTYSIDPHEARGTIDQYTWLNVPLGQSVLTDTAYVSGNWTGDADLLVELNSGQLQITETIPLQIAYHVEFMTADGDSADFVSGSGDVQARNDSQSTLAIPPELEPGDGSKHGYVVLTGNSAADGSNYAEEHKGFSRMVVDLQTSTVSGVIASERGELDSLVTTWAFVDYPLVDLRDTPAAIAVPVTASTATRVGDTTATGTGVEDDPTVYIDATGALIVERAVAHAAAFTTMYTSENYRRTGLSSIASFVGVESDTSLFDSNPPDGVDDNGKPVNLQTFAIPASSSIGIVQMSWQTIGGNATNENVGYGFAVIDLNNNTSSGSITFSRTTTPDLVAWQGVPIGTTMFGAMDGGVALYQSNKAPGDFTDDYPETARFTLIDNADGSRTLELTATSNAGTGAFADYIGTTQVSWLGSEPFRVEGVPGTGTLSHGSPTDTGGWEVDFADIPLLAISTDEHGTGELQLNLVLSSTGEIDTIIVHVQPVVDDPVLTASDLVGYVGSPVDLGIIIGDSADVDGSETQLQMLTLSGVPATVMLSADAGTVTNFGGGNWQVDSAALTTLSATGPDATTATVTVSGTNTDTDDLDGDTVIEDGNNGSGVDELDSAVYQDTFNLTIRVVPTVTSQTTNTGTPIISGTAVIGSGESLSVTVNGFTYSVGDGNLVNNGDGTWDLTVPSGNTIADGTYAVTASLSHVDGGSGSDTTTDELIIDSAPPAIPGVNTLDTSDATPIITGSAVVGPGEILTVTVDGTTYTAGDGSLVDNGNGTWTLSISNPLSEGNYDVAATVTDTAGNGSTDTTLGELTVQAIPLSTPTVVSLTTSDTTPAITGNAVVGSGNTLTVSVGGVTYTAGDGNLVHSSGGSWTLSIPTTMADDTYEVTAIVTDVFGNQYPDTSSDELVIDTTAPVNPTVTSQTTNDTTPLISGNATVGFGETLTVTVDGTTYTAGDGNLVDNGNGTWDLTVPATLAEGTYSVTATVTDSAGNSASDSSIDELIIDIMPPIVPTVSFQTTSDTTPIISGTATIGTGETLTVSVSGTTYTAGDGVLIDNGDGTWALTIPTALTDGNYSVTATVIDIAGNSSIDATALELTIDTAAPVTPTVAAQSTNSTSPTINGTATVAAGETLTVTVDGTTYTAGDGFLVNNGDGTWALSIPVTLTQGTYDVTTTVTDTAGNATSDTTASELIIDLTAPVAPGVTSLATTDATPVIDGTATLSPGETLTVEVNGVIYTAGDGNLVDNGNGTWSLTIPATNILPENLYQVIATVTDAAGNAAVDPGVDDLIVDFTAPSAPGVTSLTTNDTTPVIEGTATVLTGETLTVTVNGVMHTAADGNLVDNGDGTWMLSIPLPLVEGVYDVIATITDIAGNMSTDPSSSELLIDTTLPITPTVVPQITSDTTPTIDGTANAGPGETLRVTVDGVTYTVDDGNLLDNGDGTWSLIIPTTMAEASYEVVATVTDAAGNESTDTGSSELVIDITDPVVPTVNALITNINTPVLSGTTSTVPGETLSITIDGNTYTEGDGNLVVNADGTWDLTIPAAIADGVYEVVATITDLAGNTGTDASALELTVDTGPPLTPTVATQNTSNTTPVVSGTATVAVGETLSVTVDGVTYTAGDGNLVNNGDGTWNLTVPTPLTDSTYPVTVTVADTAGNTSSDVTTAELIIDTTAPLIPAVTLLNTSNTTPVITGTATIGAGESLTVTLDGFTYTTAGGYLVDNGDGTWNLNVPNPMADNTYDVTATVTDIAGNSSDDATVSELTIDTNAPVIPTVTALTTSNTTPDVEGTATIASGETLSVTVAGLTYSAGDGFLVNNGDGTWTLTVSTPLADGTYEVIAITADAAGNTSTDTSTDELIVDTTAPVTPTVVAQSTNSTSPTINGTATVAAGETLTVTVDGTTYSDGDGSLVNNGDGTWTLSIPVTLAEGAFDVTATVTDTAGNVTSDTTAGELIIDLTAPIAPGVTSLATTDATPLIEGTATIAAGETLTVEVNGVIYTAGDTYLVDNGDGTWALTIPATTPLAENLYQVIATVTDAAGNSATDPGVDDLLVDFTAPVTPGVSSLTTNDTTPVIEGTAIVAAGETLTVEVNGVIYTAGDGNLIDNTDGTWTLSIPVALAEALYDVTATITDIAGNISTDPSSSELLIDTTAPTTPTVVPQVTSITTPTIEGTATAGPGEILTVIVDGVTYTAGDGNLVDNGDGTWMLSIPVALAEATYEVVATVTDAAGNTSTDTNTSELVIDITDPVVPTVNTLITNINTPVLSGTTSAVPGETLSITVDGITYNDGDGNLVVNGDGTWALTIPSVIADGTYEVIATITDLAANTSTDVSALELTVDTAAPVIPTVTTQNTNNTTPVVSGTATVAAGETLTVAVDGATYNAGDGNLIDNGDGTWDLTVPAPLADSAYPVTVIVVDTAGNTSSDVTTDELIIDTIAPPTPTVVSQITNDTTPVIEGSATVAPGETLTISIDGTTYTAGDGNLVDNGNGTWALPIPASLAEGTYDVIATVTDAAGNATSDATTTELMIDTTVPVVPTVTAQNTSNTTPVISGTATVTNGETLSVTVDGVTYTAGDGNLVNNGDGTWGLTIPAPLTDSTYPVTVSVADAAGNASSDVTTAELIIDTTAPLIPTVALLNTSDTTPVITGTADIGIGESLTVTLDGFTYTPAGGYLVDNGDGTWNLNVPNAMADDNYDVTATVTDIAGNSSDDATVLELTIDTNAPVIPTVTALTTSNTTPDIEGTATIGSGETLTVTVDGSTYTAGDGNLVNNGDGTWGLTIPTALADSVYSVTATIIDAAGNFSNDATALELTIDTAAPVTPTVTAQNTNSTSPIINGTATVAAGETLTVTVDGTTYSDGDGSLVNNGDGTWTLSIPVALAEGAFDVTATVTDTAGNVTSDTTAGELIIDLTAPIAPGVTSLATTDATPLIEGTATIAAGETLTVEVNGIIYTAGDTYLVDNGDGTWALTIPATTPLAENLYQVIATVTDAAGNSATDPGVDDLLVDFTAPVTPGVSSLTTNDTTPVIEGTAIVAAGETLTVEVNGVIYTAGDGNLIDNTDGTWALSIPVALAEALYDVTATITDIAGNISTDPSSSELLIDTTAPTTPTVVPQVTSITTPTIEGTAAAGPGEILTVTVDTVTYTAGDGNLADNGDGTWMLSIPVALAEATYEVVATVTDAAGNTSTDTNTSELVIDITDPVVPTVNALITNINTPVLSGTTSAVPGETLSVTVDGITYNDGDGNLVVNGDGTWALTIPSVIADGTYEVIATITDLAGNTSTDVSALELTVDTAAPVIPTVTTQNTNNTTPVVSGTATVAAGETLTVAVDGVTYNAGDGNLIDNGDGTWDLTVPAPLADNTYSVTVSVVDAAGNASNDVTTAELVIDTNVPVIPTVVSHYTSDTTPTVSGTATVAPGEILTVTVDGTAFTAGDGSLVNNGDGTWTLSIPVPLAEASYDVIATVTDGAGNAGNDATIAELTIDTTAPVVPTVVAQNTNNNTPVISGTATVASGETLTVTVDAVIYTAGDGNLVDNGNGTWNLTVPTALTDSTYPVTVTVVDTAGNASSDVTTGELIVDTNAPLIPTVVSQITNNNTPVIEGSATVVTGETLTVTVDGTTYTAGDGFLVNNGDGTWSLSIPVPLAETSYDVIATIADGAGNTGNDATTAELIIDTTAPVVPTVVAQNTSNTTPVISGTATVATGETLTVTVDGITFTAGDGNLIDNGNGTWALSIPAPLAEGSYDIIATVTDNAGNISTDTSISELVIDTTNPVTPTVVSQNTNNTTPVIEGTAIVAAGETLTVAVDGTTYTAGDGFLVNNGDGTWVLLIPASLAEGVLDVTATVTDTAGNATSDATAGELIIDLTAPLAPGVTSLTTADATPVIEGTATIAADETLTVEVNGVTYTAGDTNLVDNGDGTWALTIPATNLLTENLYQVIATVTDTAGNNAVDPGIDDLLIDFTAPVTPGVTSQTTNITTPVIEGTAIVATGETLTVTVNGIMYTAGDGNLVNNGDGTWALSMPVPLTEALYDVTATITDIAGNLSSDPSSSELLIDTTVPITPSVVPQFTSDTTPTIAGTANAGPGETLTVTVDGVTYTAGDGNLVDNGDSTWALAIPTALNEATYEVIATVTDAAGNESTDASTGELVIDVTDPVAPSVNALITNTNTPVLSGTTSAVPGETLTINVNGITYSAGDGNLVVNTDSTWNLTIPAGNPIADGSYEVIATVTDLAGNTSADASALELTVDTAVPAIPTVITQNTSNTTPVISGTASIAPGETLTVTIDGVTYTAGDGNLVDNGDGTWDLTVPTPLFDSTYSITVSVVDAAGNTSNDATTAELTIDTNAPPTPTVTALTTSNTTPVIEGTATIATGETLTVTVDGTIYSDGDGNLVYNGDGTWALSIPVPLFEATYSVTATITDSANNASSDTTTTELVIDTTTPTVPTVVSQNTNNTTPVIEGTATVDPGEILTVTVDGVSYTAGGSTLVDNGDGTWSLSIPTPLAEGTYEVIATTTDTAGNTSTDVSADELIVDTTAPVTPTVVAQVTNSTSPVIEGTATVAAGETLTVTVDGTSYTAGDGFLTQNADGTWALSMPVSLAEGVFNITATVTDAAGNVTSDTTAGELIIDLTVPAAPGVTSLATTDATPVIEGTATIATDETLTVVVNGVTYINGDGNLVDNGDGTWSLTIPATNILTENLYQVVATVTDAAGNSAIDPGVDDLLIDFTAPSSPGVTSQTTNNTSPVIEGTATITPGDTLTVTVNGTTYIAGDGNLVNNADGTWALSIPAALVEGLYNVTAIITDIAGNTSTDPSSSELLIDTTLPTTPTVTPQFTSDTTPTIEGTANAGPAETLTVTVDGVTYTAGDGNLVDNGDGTWTLSLPVPLSEGTYDIIATVTDAAGNESTDTSTSELVIDITDPVVPTVNVLITNINTPVLSGTTSTVPGETLSINVDGVTYSAGDGNLVVNGDGTWTLSIPAAIADGVYEVIATTTDLAGSTSTDVSTIELTIDTSAPVIPTVTTQNTNSTTPVISGTATVAPGETLSVTIDGVTYTAGDGNLVDNGNGTWELTVPASLADNTYAVTVTVADAAGNTSDDVTTAELTIDTSAPPAPTVTALTTSNTTPAISGTATVAPGETLTVTLDGTTYTAGDGNLTNNGDGTWVLSIPVPLLDATYNVTTTVTDGAGNATSDATAEELIIDTTTPAVPTVASQNTSNTTPVIEGTASVDAGEILTVTVDGVNYTAGDNNLVDNGDGTWSLSIPTPLAEGTYEVIATTTDAAGNISTDTTADELIVDTTAPVTPAVAAQVTNSSSPIIEGSATVAAGETLTVTLDGTTYTAGDGFLVNNGDGTWALSIPAALAEGVFDVTATVTDTAGNATSDTTAGELIIDLTAPLAPGVTSLTTTDTTPVIEGTATVAAGETLTATVNGVTYTAGDGNLIDNGDGTWVLAIPATNILNENLYQVIAIITDAAGNSAIDPGVDDLLIDFTAPITPGVTSQTTNNTTPVIEGTAIVAPGETLTVSVNNVIYTVGDGNLLDNGDGTWALSIAVPLVEDLYDVTATITDIAGNISTDPSSSELLIDTTAPVTPTVVPQFTSDTTPAIEGTANPGPGETLSVTVDGVTYTAGDGNLVDNGDGTWSLVLPTPLVEGNYNIIATVTDAAGNTSTDTGISELVIDTTDPVAPNVLSQNTSNTTPVIEGTATVAAGEALTVTVNGTTYTAGDGYLIISGDGTWTLSIPASLTEGVFDVTATVTDTAGNATSDTTVGELIIDLTAPLAPGVTSLATTDATPVIEGTATLAPNETLSVNVNGVIYTTGDGALVDNGDGTWALTVPATNILAENLYQVIATVTDAAGNNIIDPGVDDLLVDFTAPITPGVTSQTTNDTTPVIAGTATTASGDTLTVIVNGTIYTAGDGNLTDNDDGTWALQIPVLLVEGLYDVTATISDIAGNVSNDPSSSELLIDTTLPITPGTTPLITSDTTPVIEGTANAGPGETLTVTVDGVIYTAGDGNLVDNGDGTWTLSLPTPLAEGTYDIIATVTDAAGNTSTDTGMSELIIDTTLPVTPTVDSLTTEDTTPTLTGTAVVSPGDTLSVTVDGITYTAGDGSLVDHGDGNWTLSIPLPLVEGIFAVQVTVTDNAGNTAVSASGQLSIQAALPEDDFDSDGVPDVLDLDDDNDGIPDTTEGMFDSDRDGQPDHQDLDSDNDGIADIVEVNGEDNDNDYRVDNFIDTDNNGLSDDLQLFPFLLVDSDKDRIADFRDLDSDNDGLTDLFESGGVDSNNNGRIDGFSDSNNDGADDANQINGAAGRDTDGDGLVNRLDLDTDNDGLLDVVEAGASDNDNDGILDTMQDRDLDGIPDSVDADITTGADVDGDGIDDRFDVSFVGGADTDADGIIDRFDPDINGDGYAEAVSNNLTIGQALPDSNGNGEADLLEPAIGVIRTGVQGYGGGCSISSYSTRKGSLDPLLLLLIVISSSYLWQRARIRQRNVRIGQ